MWLWLLACGTSGGRIERLQTEVFEEGGHHFRAQAGARVRAEPNRLAVDAPDGRRWFDVIWDTAEKRAMAEAWATKACFPVVWDEPVVGDGFLALGGMCTIEERRHWTLLLVRDVGEQHMMTVYTADFAFVPYEDAWVDFMSTALSMGGPAPVDTLDPDVVRRRVRVGVSKPVGTFPVIGGGVISTNVHREMLDVYARLPSVQP